MFCSRSCCALLAEQRGDETGRRPHHSGAEQREHKMTNPFCGRIARELSSYSVWPTNRGLTSPVRGRVNKGMKTTASLLWPTNIVTRGYNWPTPLCGRGDQTSLLLLWTPLLTSCCSVCSCSSGSACYFLPARYRLVLCLLLSLLIAHPL